MVKAKKEHSIADKWGETVSQKGWTPIPNLLLKNQVRLQLKPTHICVLIHLLTYWWEKDKNAFPAVKTLADRIGVNMRQVRRYFSEIEAIEVEIGGVIVKGLVKRIPRYTNSESGKGRTSNEYSLDNLIEALNLLQQEEESVSKALSQERKPNANKARVLSCD